MTFTGAGLEVDSTLLTTNIWNLLRLSNMMPFGCGSIRVKLASGLQITSTFSKTNIENHVGRLKEQRRLCRPGEIFILAWGNMRVHARPFEIQSGSNAFVSGWVVQDQGGTL